MTEMPGPVKAARVLLWIQVGLAALAILGLFALSGMTTDARAKSALTTTAIIAVVMGIVILVAVLNFPKRKRWVRYTVIVLAALGLAGNAYSIATGATPATQVLGIAFGVAILACVAGQPARDYFTE